MTTSTIYKQIRKTVDAQIPGSRIVLFGSQARGDFDKGSDYDLLVITKQKYTNSEKRAWRSRLGKELVNRMDAPFDVLMGDEKEIAIKQRLPGHIVRTALREGIDL